MADILNTSTHIRTSVRRKGVRLTKEQREQAQEKFLKAFASNANVRAACSAAGVDRSAIYQWLEKDIEFTVRYHDAEKQADDVVRAAVFQRAVLGYEKPVVSMGKVVYDAQGAPLMERVYSDSLLALLARARMSEFRDKSHVDLTANVTANVTQAGSITIDTKHLTNDELVALKQLALAMKARQTA